MIFDGFIVEAADELFDYGEDRIISIGKIGEIAVLTVVSTDRNGTCRIISALQAKR